MNLGERPYYLQVALATPVRRLFDYRFYPNTQAITPEPGQRLIVPFGNQKRLAILVAIQNQSELSDDKLKAVECIIEQQPILSKEQLQLAQWASRYYHHSLGEILFSMLPLRYRKKQLFSLPVKPYWHLQENHNLPELSTNAIKQKECLDILQKHPKPVAEIELVGAGIQKPTIKRLSELGYIAVTEQVERKSDPLPIECGPDLSCEQKDAVAAVEFESFGVSLLNGVTGSGKTEVYIQLIQTALENGNQALLLVPEIGLTPQSVSRLRRRFKVPVRVLHSGLNDSEQADIWSLAKQQEPQVIIATRSGLFAPLPQLGIIIVDEEHDASYKQMSGWQYSARDLAIVRAQQADIPIMLGSATPSLESFYKVQNGQYQELKLIERPGSINQATYQILDIRKLPLDQGLSLPLLDQINGCLERKEQVLIFLNRRGYAPVLMCHDCGWLANCSRCDSQFTLHQKQALLRCHHCEATQLIPEHCPDCHSSNITPVGQGTQRIEEALHRRFPEYEIARIDRDSTRRKGAMQAYIDDIKANKYQLLIGTQMLAKGHHFPNLSMVVILDMDAALYCADFRATERFGQLLKQVAGRAGRAEKPGRVLIQSRQPDHPYLNRLLQDDYDVFLKQLLLERENAHWPPMTHLALLKAEATKQQVPLEFLLTLKQLSMNMVTEQGVELLGPTPALQHKRAGKYRFHLLLQSKHRQNLHKCLNGIINLIETQKLAKSVRWTLDVDPLDLV